MNANQKKQQQERRGELRLLEDSIRAYEPDFNFEEVRRALAWSKENFKKPRPKSADDYFSAPIVIAKKLVTLAKADRKMILASILYPAARPLENAPLDEGKLKDIQQKFGADVRKLVERTLRFRALKMRPLDLDATQSPAAQMELFRLMGLWVSEDPDAIALRGTQVAVNLEREIEKPGTFPKEISEDIYNLAHYLHAPLAYIAGRSALRNELMDLCFKLKSPQAYVEAARVIKSAIKKSNKEQHAIKQAIVDHIEKEFGWANGVQFDVEFREKLPASAAAKASRKGQDIGDLCDLYGVRVVLKTASIKGMGDVDVNKMDSADREALMDVLGKRCLDVYGKLSREFGRNNKRKTSKNNIDTGGFDYCAYIQQQFAEAAVKEPRAKDSGRLEDPVRAALECEKYPHIVDAWFDDYITWAKASGYSAVQDVAFIRIPNQEKPIRIEFQCVDEMRANINTFGPSAGHIYYKTGLGGHAQEVMDWFKLADAELAGKPYRGKRHTLVYDQHNQIHKLSGTATVGEFLEVSGQVCGEVRILDSNNFSDKYTYGASTPLPSGCRVIPVGYKK